MEKHIYYQMILFPSVCFSEFAALPAALLFAAEKDFSVTQ